MEKLIKKYTISSLRMSKGLIKGFKLLQNNALEALPNETEHYFISRKIDSGTRDCQWGRFAMKAEISEDVSYRVWAFASNDTHFVLNDSVCGFDAFFNDVNRTLQEKIKVFEAGNAISENGNSDFLLYGISGRYLWLIIETFGVSAAVISDCAAYTHGDNFMFGFPEIYKQKNSFFHRYLSVLSSTYNDLNEKIEQLDKSLDYETAQLDTLTMFANWLGLDLGESYLDVKHLKKLIAAMPYILSHKGSRKAVEKIVGIFVESPYYIIENNLAWAKLPTEEKRNFEQLYGKSPYDCSVLINGQADQMLHSRLNFFIEQIKPVRCNLNILFISDENLMDSTCYLDMNASIARESIAVLDESSTLNGASVLDTKQ